MKSLITILFVFMLPISANAQLINDSMLKKAENGEVSFLEGEFVAFLNDTVSPGFVEHQFAALGYELSFVDIPTLKISLVNIPPDSTLERLSSHPSVLSYLNYDIEPDSAYMRGKIEAQRLKGEMLEMAMQNLMDAGPNKDLIYEFDYHVTEARLKKIMGSFRNVAYEIISYPIKSVNISVEPGTETEIMEKVEQLPYVESTALIGMLNDN